MEADGSEKMEIIEQGLEEATIADENDEDMEVRDEVYLPGRQLAEDEELVCDDSAYVMLHQASTGAPCLSFDIIKDPLGDNREQFPLTAFIVAGTQAASTHVNK
jgi:ribosome assembly protein RRB1